MFVYSVNNLLAIPFRVAGTSEPHFHSFNSLGSHHRTVMNLDAFGMPVFKKSFHPSMNPVDGPYYTFYDGHCLYTRRVLFVTFQKRVQSYYLSFGKNRFLQVTSESIHLLKFELTNTPAAHLLSLYTPKRHAGLMFSFRWLIIGVQWLTTRRSLEFGSSPILVMCSSAVLLCAVNFFHMFSSRVILDSDLS